MYVVRHDYYQMCVPDAFGVSVLDGFNNAICRNVVGKLVFPAKLAVHRNEVVRLARIYPKRDLVWQSPANRYFHARNGRIATLLVGTARCAVRTPQRGVPTIKVA